ncbi:ATP-grasp domain-containing protein [Paraconexibacter antarcticus]|uniref:biotin carboxylase n=1 Tax=Paraconexibacter antarcticus TaxID=2949664 RepID=A0ABY5DUQ4_9ACTN|nr:biotin carboxylase N-terminal domain-containing protein [Paraconexibacter antarcticus]UTI65411.1 ATP-grasp domain-containing protein [Paraconexibacter antarcticus]
MSLQAVLVANRGEIAVRVIRTVQALGLRAIAVYSDADAAAPHVRLADEAIRLGPAPAAESYLSVERVLQAARDAGADAIHPGYGFLSENAAFARACVDAGLTFIGPSGDAMEALGDKVSAKAAANAAGVPVLPGLSRPGLTDEDILAFADGTEDVFPLMVKAAAGGGGRGMRVVHERAQLAEALGAARREAIAGFGDDTLLVERYVPRSRHVEVQVVADTHGGVVHLGERECSLQRRHQKVVEESPSPVISAATRERMGSAAVELFRHAGYVGAGTCEFLVPYDTPDEFFFLEVNARLQVEHPVTELVTGLDLVELQLRIAGGHPLGLTQDDVQLRGHAVELRICAEDPSSGFLPATGTLEGYAEPRGAGIRVDSGVALGSEIGSSYDSLLAKLITFAPDRETALDLAVHAVGDLHLLGVTTNAGFLARLLESPEVRAGDMDTSMIERGVAAVGPGEADVVRAAVALAAIERLLLSEHDAGASADPWDTLVGWRIEGEAPIEFKLLPPGAKEPIVLHVSGSPADLLVTHGEDEWPGAVERVDATRVAVRIGGRRTLWHRAARGQERWVAAGADAFAFTVVEPAVQGADAAGSGALEAPMPGTVLSVRTAEGDAVSEGDVLVVIESMKMELSLTAPADAVVSAVHVSEGQSVRQGQAVVELESGED